MRLIFISNFLNHHQLPLCQAFAKRLGEEFVFLNCGLIDQERVKLGYQDMNDMFSFSKLCVTPADNCFWSHEVAEADHVIFGSGDWSLLKERTLSRKPILFYSERLFKNPLKTPLISLSARRHFCKPSRNGSYLLAAGQYSQKDFNSIGLFKDRTIFWGYFPQGVNGERENKDFFKDGVVRFLWAGRFLQWKHPEMAVDALERFLKAGIPSELTLIGCGSKEKATLARVKRKGLEPYVRFTGPLQYKTVLRKMAESDIFLLTSDRQEGWGAVLNEAMSAGCCCVACNQAGSVDYLIHDKKNGIKFHNRKGLFEALDYLIAHIDTVSKMGIQARRTIVTDWNADVAVGNLLRTLENASSCERTSTPKPGKLIK